MREGNVVTAAFAGSDSRVRLTLAGGTQADGKLQLIDEYSGLALLKCDTKGLSPIDLAQAAPAVGQELITAAAWGLEKPLVARAIVGGVDELDGGLVGGEDRFVGEAVRGDEERFVEAVGADGVECGLDVDFADAFVCGECKGLNEDALAGDRCGIGGDECEPATVACFVLFDA